MKKVSISIVIFLLVIFVGCRKNTVHPSVNGNWIFYEYAINDTSRTDFYGIMTEKFLYKHGIMHFISFKSENKFTINEYLLKLSENKFAVTPSESGKWEQIDDSIFLSKDKKVIYKGRIIGTKLHLQERSGDTINIKRYKIYSGELELGPITVKK